MIPRKHAATTEQWNQAWDHARANPDKDAARRLVDDAATEITNRLAEFGDRPAYAWSGGKDSIALQTVMEHVDRPIPAVWIRTDLEYPSFDAWVRTHKPAALAEHETGLDLPWLVRHQAQWLFPANIKDQHRWFRQRVQWTGQRQWCEQTNTDVLVMGRRLKDGNYVGRDGVNFKKRGAVKWSPLYRWTHEDVLTVLAAFDRELPPVYGHSRGWDIATGPWPKRRRHPDGLDATWDEVYAAEPAVVHTAATMIDCARDYLERRTT